MFTYILLGLLLTLSAIVLILVVLVQRGRGGGLSGAFGGAGGQSAFGAKAGDVFTRVTIGVAAFWILTCMASVKFLGGGPGRLSQDLGGASESETGSFSAPVDPGEGTGATEGGGANEE